MSSGWIVVCQPLPVSSCNGRPEYSCQARFANSAEPSARAHNTKAGMVSIRYRRSSGSVLRLAPCVSEVIFVNTGSHKNGIHKKQFRSEEFPVQACSSISQASTGGLSETSLYFSLTSDRLRPKPKTKDSFCSLGGAADRQSVFVWREIGVLPQRMPANSEGMCPEPRVQHKPAGHCIYVVHTHNDAGIATPESRCPIFEFNHLVGAPAGQRSLAHTKIAQVTNDGCSFSDGSRKRSLDI